MKKCIPKRHHTVTRSYLERFADPSNKKLWVCDLRKKEWRNQKPSEVMIVNHYNRQEWVPDGIDANIFEDALSKIETKVKIIIDKMIDSPQSITNDDISWFLIYLEILRVNVPRQANHAKALMTKLLLDTIEGMPDIAEAVRSGLIKVRVKEKEARFKFIKTVNGALIPYFARMHWYIYTAPGNSSFITIDSPVVFYNRLVMPPTEPGIALVGTLVFFALSPKHMLVLKHPEYVDNPKLDPTIRIELGPLDEIGTTLHYGWETNDNMVNSTNKMMAILAFHYIVGLDKRSIENSLH
jgi:hypothetical protein